MNNILNEIEFVDQQLNGACSNTVSWHQFHPKNNNHHPELQLEIKPVLKCSKTRLSISFYLNKYSPIAILISQQNIFLAYPCVPERYILALRLMRLISLLVLSAKYCDIDFYFSLSRSL